MDRLTAEALHMLETRRDTLRATLRLVEADSEGGERAPGDLADLADTAQVSRKVFERERNELREIEWAIDRIHERTWGDCQACGRAIGRQRLRAMPETRLCLACAGAQELRDAQDLQRRSS